MRWGGSAERRIAVVGGVLATGCILSVILFLMPRASLHQVPTPVSSVQAPAAAAPQASPSVSFNYHFPAPLGGQQMSPQPSLAQAPTVAAAPQVTPSMPPNYSQTAPPVGQPSSPPSRPARAPPIALQPAAPRILPYIPPTGCATGQEASSPPYSVEIYSPRGPEAPYAQSSATVFSGTEPEAFPPAPAPQPPTIEAQQPAPSTPREQPSVAASQQSPSSILPKDAPTVAAHPTAIPGEVLPGFFPWPPPAPSAAISFGPQFLTDRKLHTLGDAAVYIERMFQDAGYNEFRYYAAGTGGIVIVTPIHRMDEVGQTMNSTILAAGAIGVASQPTRLPSAFSVASILTWIKTIFGDETAHLRLFVVTITEDAVIPDQSLKPTGSDIDNWMTLGALSLPNQYAARSVSSNERISILVYEFTNDKTNGSQFVARSGMGVEVHVLGARLSNLFSSGR
jgi:hypothetical protein